jgi:nitrogen fixation/metabolism regulation signal transduction histidine kinase
MNQSAYLFLGLTAIVGALAGVLAYSLAKFIVAARDVGSRRRSDGGQAELMANAIEEALRSLREQERAMKARAEASERLSEQIVASLTSGLLVVDHTGIVRTLNPAGRRLLGLPDSDLTRPHRAVLSSAPELADHFAKPAELILAPLEMEATVSRAAEDIRSEVQSRSGELSVKGTFGRVLGDDVLLRQAISNLCRNALEACVDAGIVPRITIEGSVDHENRTLRISVSDNGPGIKPNIAERIFRPFFTTKAKGTGLGLALVQKIIVTHNGRVALVPHEDPGARIAVTLPLGER